MVLQCNWITHLPVTQESRGSIPRSTAISPYSGTGLTRRPFKPKIGSSSLPRVTNLLFCRQPRGWVDAPRVTTELLPLTRSRMRKVTQICLSSSTGELEPRGVINLEAPSSRFNSCLRQYRLSHQWTHWLAARDGRKREEDVLTEKYNQKVGKQCPHSCTQL